MSSVGRVPRWSLGILVALACLGTGTVPGAAAPGGDDAKKNPTFSKDVAPILQRKCQVCHHPGTVAPMSLMTYDEVRPWVKSIQQRVARREMPPWHIDRTQGIQEYKNDRSL